MRSPGFAPAGRVDGLPQLRGDGLGQRRLRPLAALADLGAREALGAHALHVLLELVDLGAREAHAPAGTAASPSTQVRPPSTASLQHGHAAAVVLLDELGEVDVRQLEAQVGLVVAVLRHRLGEGHAREGAVG